MTLTTKVETRTFADLNVWGLRFDKRPIKEMAAYLSSYNMGVTQTVAFAAVDPATTGTSPIMINGVVIESLTAEANADWSETTASTIVEGDAKGETFQDTYMVDIIVYARSTGLLRIDMAGEVELDADICLQIPHWDASVWAPIAIVNVNAGGEIVLGTTDINAEVTITQLLGAVLPHPDNFQN